MATNGSELCFGLMLLLEAAEYHNDATLVTPLCTRKRDVAIISSLSMPFPACPVKPIYSNPVSFPSSTKKRIKFSFDDANSPSNSIRVRSNLGDRENTLVRSNLDDLKCLMPEGLCNTKLSTPIKKSVKCSEGSVHRVWEITDECAMTATSSGGFNSSTSDQRDVEVESERCKTFVLYNKGDDKHINAIHNVVRRDIWEGFVVDATKDAVDATKEESSNARRSGRLARYDGTIGFRCRFCKNAPLSQRADKSAVYPRTVERIYLANIRFQRDHIERCTFIPNEIKESYLRLKSCNGVSRGRKQYWVSSATRKGLCNGEKGIVFSKESKQTQAILTKMIQ